MPFSCTHLAIQRQGKRPKVHAKQKGIKNFFTPYDHFALPSGPSRVSRHLFGLDVIYYPLKQCARLPYRRRHAAGTPLCATVQAGQNGHLDDGQEGMTRFVLCKKKKTVVVLLDNMKNSSSSTVITVSRNCPRAPDDCSMKAGVEPEIPRCSCLPHIRTVQKLLKINKHRRW